MYSIKYNQNDIQTMFNRVWNSQKNEFIYIANFSNEV